jgi:hypothetical protein
VALSSILVQQLSTSHPNQCFHHSFKTVKETDILNHHAEADSNKERLREDDVGSNDEDEVYSDEEAPPPRINHASTDGRSANVTTSDLSPPDELDGCDTTGTLLLAGDPTATVANCCAICLCPYEVSDQVVWSRNQIRKDEERRCPHAFHIECMVEWLVCQCDDESTPCPCCRRDFIDKAIISRRREQQER